MRVQANKYVVKYLQKYILNRRKHIFQVSAYFSTESDGRLKSYNNLPAAFKIKHNIVSCNVIRRDIIKTSGNDNNNKANKASCNGEKEIVENNHNKYNVSTLSCPIKTVINVISICKPCYVLSKINQSFLLKPMPVMCTKGLFVHSSALKTVKLIESKSSDIHPNTNEYIRSVLIGIPDRDSSGSAAVATKPNYLNNSDKESKNIKEDGEQPPRNQSNDVKKTSTQDVYLAEITNYCESLPRLDSKPNSLKDSRNHNSTKLKHQNSKTDCTQIDVVSKQTDNKNINKNVSSSLPVHENVEKNDNAEKNVPNDKSVNRINNIPQLKISNKRCNNFDLFKEWNQANKDLKQRCNFQELMELIGSKDKPNNSEEKKSNSQKLLSNVYKVVPPTPGNELKSLATPTKATLVSTLNNTEKDEEIRKNSTPMNLGETYSLTNAPRKDSNQQALFKYLIHSEGIAGILKEHKLLLEALLDKVTLDSEKKNKSKVFKQKASKNEKTKYEQVKYQILQQVWKNYLKDQEKLQEKVKRVISSKNEATQIDLTSKKQEKHFLDTLTELVDNVNLELSLKTDRDVKMIGSQIGDALEMTDTDRIKRIKKPLQMTSPSKRHYINKSEISFEDVKSNCSFIDEILGQKIPNSTDSFKHKRGSIRTISYNCSPRSFGRRNGNISEVHYYSKNKHILQGCPKVSKVNISDERVQTMNSNENKKEHLSNPLLSNSKHKTPQLLSKDIPLKTLKRDYQGTQIERSNNYQLSEKDSKLQREKKSINELKNKIMLRRKLQKQEEAIAQYAYIKRANQNQLYNSGYSNYTVSGPDHIRNEYNAPSKAWNPHFEPGVNEYKMSPASSVESHTIKSTTQKKNWAMSSPVPYINNFLEFRKRKQPKNLYDVHNNFQKSKEHEQLLNKPESLLSTKTTNSPSINNFKEFRTKNQASVLSQYHDAYPPGDNQDEPIQNVQAQPSSPKRNWTTVSPVTFVDNVLEFRFKKQGNPKPKKQEEPIDSKHETNKTKINSFQQGKFNSSYNQENVSTTNQINSTTNTTAHTDFPHNTRKPITPAFKDDISKQIWLETFKIY